MHDYADALRDAKHLLEHPTSPLGDNGIARNMAAALVALDVNGKADRAAAKARIAELEAQCAKERADCNEAVAQEFDKRRKAERQCGALRALAWAAKHHIVCHTPAGVPIDLAAEIDMVCDSMTDDRLCDAADAYKKGAWW